MQTEEHVLLLCVKTELIKFDINVTELIKFDINVTELVKFDINVTEVSELFPLDGKKVTNFIFEIMKLMES